MEPIHIHTYIQGFPDGSEVKNLPDMQETPCNAGDASSILWSRRSPGEKEMATHSSILAWKIPWTEEPDGLQSTGLQRVGQDLVTKPPQPVSHCQETQPATSHNQKWFNKMKRQHTELEKIFGNHLFHKFIWYLICLLELKRKKNQLKKLAKDSNR